LLPRLIFGIIREIFLFFTERSVFLDSELSNEGTEQVKRLQKYISQYDTATADDVHLGELMKALRADRDSMSSVVVSSNLRRAVSTACISLWPRLKATGERVIVLSALQEMTRNVDTQSLTEKGCYQDTTLLKKVLKSSFSPDTYLDIGESAGNKTLSSQAIRRMEDFCRWSFERSEQVIIVGGGHSIWFKKFFKVFLPSSVEHDCKTRKIQNAGAIAFKLEKGVVGDEGLKVGYRVDIDSLSVVFGGFDKSDVKGGHWELLLGDDAEKSKRQSSRKVSMNGKGPLWTCCSGRG